MGLQILHKFMPVSLASKVQTVYQLKKKINLNETCKKKE
jgi:hypothetical protein